MPSIFEGESHTPKIKQINVYLTRFWTLTLMLQQFRYANLFYFRYSKTCFQIDFISFMVSFEKSLYIKMMVFFRILLNYLKYVIFKSVYKQRYLVGPDLGLFVLWGPILWHLPISTSLSNDISDFSFTSFWCLIRFFFRICPLVQLILQIIHLHLKYHLLQLCQVLNLLFIF